MSFKNRGIIRGDYSEKGFSHDGSEPPPPADNKTFKPSQEPSAPKENESTIEFIKRKAKEARLSNKQQPESSPSQEKSIFSKLKESLTSSKNKENKSPSSNPELDKKVENAKRLYENRKSKIKIKKRQPPNSGG